MTKLTQSAKSLTGGPNASKPVSSFTTKTMRQIRHPAPPQKNSNVIKHKTYWRRLTNVWYGSLTGSETQTYIYSSLTVWRQSIQRQ